MDRGAATATLAVGRGSRTEVAAIGVGDIAAVMPLHPPRHRPLTIAAGEQAGEGPLVAHGQGGTVAPEGRAGRGALRLYGREDLALHDGRVGVLDDDQVTGLILLPHPALLALH